MRLIQATGTAAVFLLVGTIVPAYAQHDRQDEEHGKGRAQKEQSRPKEKGRSQQVKQAPQRPQAHEGVRGAGPQRPQAHERAQPAPQQRPVARQRVEPHRTQQRATAWQQQRGWMRAGAWQGRGNWQQNRARQWAHEHRTWAQRGGYGGYFIPRDRFDVYFGVRHPFRMHAPPSMYMGYPRFLYGGFSFLLVDPWPESWQPNWFDTDELYIDYSDGYYLYDRRHPGIALAITVVM